MFGRGDQGTTAKERFSNLPQFSLEVSGIYGPRLKSELSRGGVYVSSWASDLLDRLQKPERQEQVSTVKFRLRDVGIRDYVSGMGGWDKVVHAIKKEGLDLLPQLTAPEMSLHNPDIIGNGEWVDFLSKPITDRYGGRSVFALERGGGGLGLDGGRAGSVWLPDGLAVARLR